MAQGFIVKQPDGSLKQVPFDQAASAGLDPNQIAAWQQHIAQPNQQLQQGELNLNRDTQLLQPTVDSANAHAQVDKATIEADIRAKNADSQAKELATKKANQLIASGANLASVKGADGKVSPVDYNRELENYIGAGGTSEEFSNAFRDKYVNPNNVNYDTPENISIRKVFPEVASLIKTYANLQHTGQNWQNLANSPVLGGYLKQTTLHDNTAYGDLLYGVSANLRNIAGAGQGSGIRGNLTELSNIIGLLPQPYDSKEVANSKISNLDDLLQKNYGVSFNDLMK